MRLLPPINYPSTTCKIGIKSKSFRLFENGIFENLETFERIKKYSSEERDVKTVILLGKFPMKLLTYLMFKGPGSFRSPQKRDLFMKLIDVAAEVCEIAVRFYHGKRRDVLDNAYITMWSVLRCLKKAYKKERFLFMDDMGYAKRLSYFSYLKFFVNLNDNSGVSEQITSHCAGGIYLANLNEKFNDLHANLHELRAHMIRAREFIARKEIFPYLFDGIKVNALKLEFSEPNDKGKREILYKWETPPFFRFRNLEAKLENEYLQKYKPTEESDPVQAALKIVQTQVIMRREMGDMILGNSALFSVLLFHAIQIRWVNTNDFLLDFQKKYSIRRRRLLELGYEEPSLEERKENLARNIAMMEMEHGETN